MMQDSASARVRSPLLSIVASRGEVGASDVRQPIGQLLQAERNSAIVRELEELPLRCIGPASPSPVADRTVSDPKGLSYGSHSTEFVDDALHGRIFDTRRVKRQAPNVSCKSRGMRHNLCMAKKGKTAFDIACGRRLALARRALGLSQEELAPVMGLSRQGLGNYEQGTRQLDPKMVIRLYARYRITSDYIYRGDLVGLPPELATKLAPELAQLTA